MANKEFFITIKYDKVITELVAIRRKVNELLEYIEMRDAEQANDAVGTVGDPLNLLLYLADDACRDKWGSP